MLTEKVLKLITDIEALDAKSDASRELPQNSFYLDNDDVVCGRREYGESREPYMQDGLLAWARQNGHIDINDRGFCIFRPCEYGEDSPLGFFGGIPDKAGTFRPISLFEANARSNEGEDICRYTVFSLKCCYYIATVGELVFALRLHLDKEKHIHFAFCALNRSTEVKNCYMASFMEAVLLSSPFQSFWDRMGKFGKHLSNGGFTLRTYGNCLAINTRVAGNITNKHATVAREAFIGVHGRTVGNAESLVRGVFDRNYEGANTAHLPIASDLIHFELPANGSAEIDYQLTLCWNPEVAEKTALEELDMNLVERELEKAIKTERGELDSMKMTFEGEKATMPNAGLMNHFVHSLERQISFCALGISYAGDCMGVRDVYQQLEQSLIWQPDESRAQIVKTLNNILSSGRPPRQFTMPADPNQIPYFNLNEYIDQGVWIISTIYSYLAYTGDYSLLDEKCGYYDCDEDSNSVTGRSDKSDTVLEHMITIMGYLTSKVDTEYGTNCLRVLFGDWNDALDGLGKTNDEGKKFGSGVTVMATLQLRRNLGEMCEILGKVGKFTDKISEYTTLRERITEGIKKYAVDTDEKSGRKRIVHGWGDKLGYKVGSFRDPDGKARISLTSNAFWAISGMTNETPELRESIVEDIMATDSRYGLKTFDKPFSTDCEGVGRIVYIVPGTYENSCSYAHAGMFGTMALFALGEPKKAWEQFSKLMVITHKNASMSTFAMPNSYCENAEYGMDGESMGDWYTGSGTTCIKTLVRYGFGLRPTLDGLRLVVPEYIPFDKMTLTLKLSGKTVTVTAHTTGKDITLNGKKLETEKDEISKSTVAFIPNSDLKDGAQIEINA